MARQKLPALWRAALAACSFLMTLASCGEQHTTSGPPARSPLPNLPTATWSPNSTKTKPPTPVSTETPGPTSLPADTYILPVQAWPENGNLLQPFEGEVTFKGSLQDLPPGDYLLLGEEREHTIGYVSLDGKISGVFMSLGEGLGLPFPFADPSVKFLLGKPGKVSRLYDLETREAWQLGPVCPWRSILMPSADGKWVAMECQGVQMEGVSGPHIVAEAVSTQDGRGIRIAIPRVPTPSSDRVPYINWLDASRLFVSDAWVDGDFRACALTIPSGLLYCPSAMVGDKVPFLFGIALLGNDRIALTYVQEQPWKSMLVAKTCFDVGGSCRETTELGEAGTDPIPSADPGVVWWMTLLEPARLVRIGVYLAPSWESKQIAELDGDYRMQALCPDGRCIFLEKLDSTLRYRLDLDGTLTVVPYQEIIGTFSIP